MSAGLEAAFAEVSTSAISDAMDRIGIAGQALGIVPMQGSFRITGRAFTVRYLPVGASGGTVGDFIDDVRPGQVVVLDNGGRVDCTVWGDILTSTASHRGVAGTVIDGICRDLGRSVDLGYPIFAKGNWMRTGKDRVYAAAVNDVVQIGGVRVASDDLIVGDGDGVVVIPGGCEEQVLQLALNIEQVEELIRASVEKGRSLVEARAENDYHRLQRRLE